MFDFNFNWDESLNTNITIVDEQNKELFRIGRDVEQLLLTNCINAENRHLLAIICDLREYIGYHFYYEECLMEQYNYSEMQGHIKDHLNYRKVIENFDVKRLGEEPFAMLTKLRETLVDFVLKHILIEDKKMANEILPKMNAGKHLMVN